MTLDDVINDLIHLIYTDTCRVQNDVVLIDLRHIQQTVEHLSNVGKAAVRDDQGDVCGLLQSQSLGNCVGLVAELYDCLLNSALRVFLNGIRLIDDSGNCS